MTTLNLGVVEVPYVTALPPAARRAARWRQGRRPWQRLAATMTTGDVAEILERRYGLFSMFYLIHGADIAAALEEAMRGKLENLLMGGPVSETLFGDADLGVIEQEFRKFLDNQEMDGRASGVPTAAALRGVSHRMGVPRKHRGPRPSFIDTGLLQASFKAFVT